MRKKNSKYKGTSGLSEGTTKCDPFPGKTGRNESSGPNQLPTHPRQNKGGDKFA